MNAFNEIVVLGDATEETKANDNYLSLDSDPAHRCSKFTPNDPQC
jgi:hypothetical protein